MKFNIIVVVFILFNYVHILGQITSEITSKNIVDKITSKVKHYDKEVPPRWC